MFPEKRLIFSTFTHHFYSKTRVMYSFREFLDITEHDLASLNYPPKPDGLYAPMRYALDGGGKRIRPILVLMGCNLFRESVTSARPVAMAVEVFHNFTLLHDDIMDASDTRRGKPSVYKKWNENTAILSGDMMLIYAYRLLTSCEAQIVPQLLEVFNNVALGVCEGQQYDMEFETREDVSVDEYLEMIRLKTAILLGGALQLGAICGGASAEQTELLYRFGLLIGLAFQLQDDLLDTYGDPAILGKPVGEDILAGKKNFLLSSALSLTQEADRQKLLSLLRDTTLPAAEKITAVKAIYDKLNLKQRTEQKISEYFDTAFRTLDVLEIDPERLQPLRDLASGLLKRQK